MRRAVFLVLFCSAIAIVSPAQTFTNLSDFDRTKGAQPEGSLIQATDGSFYGTTKKGGDANDCVADGCGTVFKVTPGGNADHPAYLQSCGWGGALADSQEASSQQLLHLTNLCDKFD